MKLEVLGSPESAAHRGAEVIAADARAAVAARGIFVFAVSGGRTPWLMLRDLAAADLPWPSVNIVQVDERVAPEGDPDRNLTHLRESFLDLVPLIPENIHWMPVESPDLEAAAARYAATLQRIAGSPTILDLVHLGLGPDGHTASLVPGDPALIAGADVAVTEPYQGRRRMTLTYPILNRARRVLWVITGDEKREMLQRLIAGDESIPAGRVRRENASVIADKAAAESQKPSISER